MVEGDPSLDPSLDPSSKKPSCRAPAEPDDKPDPEVVITDNAIEVLAHLNQVSGSRYQKSKTSLENIRARLREGHTVSDLKLVIDVKHEHWHGNDEQYQYMRPETLFGLKNSRDICKALSVGMPKAARQGVWDKTRPRDVNSISPVQTTIPRGSGDEHSQVDL
jgi:uncharacterized phage protein (TIGR02220 family)